MAETARPRVVVVVSHLGFGGAERQTLDLLRQLRGAEWAPVGVICLSAHADAHGEAVRDLGYELSSVPRAGTFDAGRVVALRRLLRQQRADVIHAINWFASGYAVLARPRGARVVSSIRNSHLPTGALRRLALTRLVRRADRVLVNSECGRQLVMDACRVPSGRIALVPNGVDLERLNSVAQPGALRRELGIPADAPVALYIGRHARVKNIPRLLAVVSALLRERPDVRVVLAGEGLGPELVAGTPLARESRLSLLGPRRDVPSLLRDATLLLLTSDHEGMPNVVLEALASGVPVVATDVGDLARMVPGACGALTPCDDRALSAAALRVIADAPTYQRAAEAHAATLAGAWSPQAMATRTVDVWRQVGGSVR